VGWSNCLSPEGQLQGGEHEGEAPASAAAAFNSGCSRCDSSIERITIQQEWQGQPSHQKTAQEKKAKTPSAMLHRLGRLLGAEAKQWRTVVAAMPKKNPGPTLALKVVHNTVPQQVRPVWIVQDRQGILKLIDLKTAKSQLRTAADSNGTFPVAFQRLFPLETAFESDYEGWWTAQIEG